jgi:hypothetical protein
MKRYLSFLVRCAGVVLFVLAFVAPGYAEPFDLLAARQLEAFGGGIISSTVAPGTNGGGGTLIFEERVFKPSGRNLLIITFSGTGWVHQQGVTKLSCLVDGVACDPRGDGWTRVQNFDTTAPGTEGGDWHANNINQTWCKLDSTAAGVRNVKLRLGVQGGNTGRTAFVERVKVYVYSANVAASNACTTTTVP